MNSTVRNIVKDSVGDPINGVQVTIELFGLTDGQTPGFVDITPGVTSDFTINTSATVNTDVNGLWQESLVGNDDIVPLGTSYKITEKHGNISRVYYIDVPNDGGTYWVGNILDPIPGNVSLILDFDHLSDVDVSSVTNKQGISYKSGTDSWTPQQVLSTGTFAGRPTAGLVGNPWLYFATDTEQLFYDNLSSWIEISTAGGGGGGLPLTGGTLTGPLRIETEGTPYGLVIYPDAITTTTTSVQNVHAGGFLTGTGSLLVKDTTNFNSIGTIWVRTSGPQEDGLVQMSYSSTDATHFLNCQTLTGTTGSTFVGGFVSSVVFMDTDIDNPAAPPTGAVSGLYVGGDWYTYMPVDDGGLFNNYWGTGSEHQQGPAAYGLQIDPRIILDNESGAPAGSGMGIAIQNLTAYVSGHSGGNYHTSYGYIDQQSYGVGTGNNVSWRESIDLTSEPNIPNTSIHAKHLHHSLFGGVQNGFNVYSASFESAEQYLVGSIIGFRAGLRVRNVNPGNTTVVTGSHNLGTGGFLNGTGTLTVQSTSSFSEPADTTTSGAQNLYAGGFLNGTGILNVVSTTGFASSGSIYVHTDNHPVALVSYTSTTATTFEGCKTLTGTSGSTELGGSVTPSTAVITVKTDGNYEIAKLTYVSKTAGAFNNCSLVGPEAADAGTTTAGDRVSDVGILRRQFGIQVDQLTGGYYENWAFYYGASTSVAPLFAVNHLGNVFCTTNTGLSPVLIGQGEDGAAANFHLRKNEIGASGVTCGSVVFRALSTTGTFSSASGFFGSAAADWNVFSTPGYLTINTTPINAVSTTICAKFDEYQQVTLTPASDATWGLLVKEVEGAAMHSILIEKYGSFTGPFITTRSANGTQLIPTQVTTDKILMSLAGTGWHSGGAFSGSQAILRFHAAQNFTSTARGTYIRMHATPSGSITAQYVMDWRCNSTASDIRIYGYGTTSINSLALYASGGTQGGGESALGSTSVLGRYSWYGYDATNYVETAAIEAVSGSGGAWSSVAHGTYLKFYTTAVAASSTIAETARLGPTGNFGAAAGVHAGSVTAPATTLTVNGMMNVTPQAITVVGGASNDNIAVTSSVVRITGFSSGSGPYDITGFAYAGGNKDGTLLVVMIEITSAACTITHDTVSTAANRIYTNDTSPHTGIAGGGSNFLFCYNGSESRWRLIAQLL